MATINPVQDTTFDLIAVKTIFGTGTDISVPGNNSGIFGDPSEAWNVTNEGEVYGSNGIYLLSKDCKLTNSGTITGRPTAGANGVVINVGTSVINSGYIQGPRSGIVENAAGALSSITNSGTITSSEDALRLNSGGKVSNTGTITGEENGVYVKGAAGTVTNSQYIFGSGGTADAINMSAGGTVTNNAGGIIEGYGYGVSITGAVGKVTNSGTIAGAVAVRLGNAGSSVNNTSAGYLYGVGMTNALELQGGGSVINSGRIRGAFGVVVTGGTGVVTNNTGGGIYGGQAGDGAGVSLNDGGTVTNRANIYGYQYGVVITGAKGTLTNVSGIISGVNGTGVAMAAGGSLTNDANATISGAAYGVAMSGSGASVTNFGLITGGGASVTFLGGGKNTLTLETGSSLGETAFGSQAAGAVNTLSLVGHGVETQAFLGFQNLTVAASGGVWELAGTSDFSGNATISSGTLQIGDVNDPFAELTMGGRLANNGVFDDEHGIVEISGAVSGTGTVRLGQGARLEFDGVFSQNVIFGSGTGLLDLAKSKSYAATISGFAKGDTLDLRDIKFVSSTEATFAGGVLTVNGGGSDIAKISLFGSYMASFTAASDGHGGTLVSYTPPQQPALVVPGH